MSPRRLKLLIGRLRGSDDGMAAVELALFAPLLAMLLLGGYDLSRFISIRSGVDKVGFSVADVTSQYKELPEAKLNDIFRATGASLPTYVSGTNGVTVLSSIYLNASGVPKVRWQCTSSPSNTTFTYASRIGSEGGNADINAALLADVNDNVMVSEVFYFYKPIFSTFFKKEFKIYTSSIYRPRLGSLTVSPCPK